MRRVYGRRMDTNRKVFYYFDKTPGFYDVQDPYLANFYYMRVHSNEEQTISDDLLQFKLVMIKDDLNRCHFEFNDHSQRIGNPTTISRYFEVTEYCPNCREFTHQLKECQFYNVYHPDCMMCLSNQHHTYACRQERKAYSDTLRQGKLQRGNKIFDDVTEDEMDEVTCLNCLKQGHQNCSELRPDNLYQKIRLVLPNQRKYSSIN